LPRSAKHGVQHVGIGNGREDRHLFQRQPFQLGGLGQNFLNLRRTSRTGLCQQVLD